MPCGVRSTTWTPKAASPSSVAFGEAAEGVVGPEGQAIPPFAPPVGLGIAKRCACRARARQGREGPSSPSAKQSGKGAVEPCACRGKQALAHVFALRPLFGFAFGEVQGLFSPSGIGFPEGEQVGEAGPVASALFSCFPTSPLFSPSPKAKWGRPKRPLAMQRGESKPEKFSIL